MKVISNYKTTLSASMTSSQNTVPVTDITTTDGHTITASDFDNFAYLVIEPGSSNMEIVKVTGVSGSSFTGAIRGLAFYGGTETSVPANQYAHQSGSTIIMTNAHYYFNNFVDTVSNQAIAGVKTFSSTPVVPVAAPTLDTQVANKKYVDDVVIAGGVDASSTLKGISKLSSNPSVSTNPIALNSEEVAATSGANKVVRANASGKIDTGFISDGTSSGLEAGAGNGTQVKIKTGGGLVRDTNGLSVDSSIYPSPFIPITAFSKITAGQSLAIGNGTVAQINSQTNTSANTANAYHVVSNNTKWVGYIITTPDIGVQSYITTVNFKINNIAGTFNGNEKLSIRATSAGLPTGADLDSVILTTQTGAYVITATLPGNVLLQPNTQYAIIIRTNTETIADLSFYGNVVSLDSGSTWAAISPLNTTPDCSAIYKDVITSGQVFPATSVSADSGIIFLGFAKDTVANGATENVIVSGAASGFTGLTIGSIYYLNNNNGVIGTSVGSQSKKVGIAISTTQLLVINN